CAAGKPATHLARSRPSSSPVPAQMARPRISRNRISAFRYQPPRSRTIRIWRARSVLSIRRPAAESMRIPIRLAWALLAVAITAASHAPREDVDLLLRGGTVIDGSGAAPRVADVAIRGDRIVFIGDAGNANLTSMRALVRRGMDEGAIGMSTGLYYAPGSYSPTDEVIELAKVAARYGGIYDTHLRDESSYTIGLVGAVNEAIRIGREAKIPIHISHIKALGTDVWGQSDSVIALIRKARAEGIDVTAGQYPYNASGTSVEASLLPRWAKVGGRDSLRARIADPATRARLTKEMENNLRRRVGASSLLISSTRDTSILGRTLEEIAAKRHESPIDAALQIVQQGDASVA